MFQAHSEVTDSFVDTAITLGKRVISDQNLLNLLLKADEFGQDENPLNEISKLQCMVSKSKTAKNIRWVFHAALLDLFWEGYTPQPRFDGWRNGHLDYWMLTWRALRDGLNGKGTCDVFIGLLEFREYLFTKIAPSLGQIIHIDVLTQDLRMG